MEAQVVLVMFAVHHFLFIEFTPSVGRNNSILLLFRKERESYTYKKYIYKFIRQYLIG